MFDDGRLRRNSGYSQFTERFRSPMSAQVVPPQLYGSPVPTTGFGAMQVAKTTGMKPGSRNYYVGFDTMNIAKGRKVTNENVVISGYEGGLSINIVSRSGQTRIGGIGGLRGGVFNAKILPWTINDGSRRGSSLIAVVIHGPVLNDEDVEFGEEAGDKRASSGSSVPRVSPRGSHKGGNSVTSYQTTVEVYDLRTKRYIATLLALPKIELALPVQHARFMAPPPTGALSIQADAGNIVITSGVSGEVFVFRQYREKEDKTIAFRPIGKFWTTIQSSPVPEPSSASYLDTQRTPNGGEKARTRKTKSPLISLRGRWLALVPNGNIHQIPLGASINVSRSPKSKIPGLNSFAPPGVPKTDCAVETRDAEAEGWGALSRTAAQEAIKGGKWIADQGSKAWSTYWNKTPPSGASTGWTPPSSYQQAEMFPPTHGSGAEGASAKEEPASISIVDLEVLAKTKSSNATAATLATFRPPGGCSHISLSPSGLHLFTASAKGDVQYVWDLFRIKHARSSPIQPLPTGHSTSNHVREIARFTRLTIARIVDVVWNEHGGMVGMVTERGTVHFLDLPRGASVWPPPRSYRKRTGKSTSTGKPVAPATAALAMATTAASTAWSFAGPLFARPRGFSSESPQIQDGGAVTPNSTTSASAVPTNRAAQLAALAGQFAGQGGKVIKHGISKSVGAVGSGVESFRRKGDNKLHLPISASPPGSAGGSGSGLGISTANCIRFFGTLGHSKNKRRTQLFAVILDGTVKIFRVRHIVSKNKKGVPVRRVHVSSKSVDVTLPHIPEHTLSSLVRRALDLDADFGDETDSQLSREAEREARRESRRESRASRTSTSTTDPERGGNTAILPLRPQQQTSVEGESFIPFAEIESGAPYQPFHTDPRVTLSVYTSHPAGFGATEDETSESLAERGEHHSHPSPKQDTWIFGRPIETKIIISHRPTEEVSEDGSVLERVMSREGEEIVCTTRRRGSLRMIVMLLILPETVFEE